MTNALMELADRLAAESNRRVMQSNPDSAHYYEDRRRDLFREVEAALRTAAAEGGAEPALYVQPHLVELCKQIGVVVKVHNITAATEETITHNTPLYLHPPTDSGAGRDGSGLVAAGTKMSNVLFNFKQRPNIYSQEELLLMEELQKEWDREVRKSSDGEHQDRERLDFIERTFSGMTNRERYLPVQMIWGKGANGRTLREACDKYMAREQDTAIAGAAGEGR